MRCAPCLQQIGSEGSAIVPVINKSIAAWTNSSLREVRYVLRNSSSTSTHSNITTTTQVPQRDPSDSVMQTDIVVSKVSASSSSSAVAATESSIRSSRPSGGSAYDLSILRSLLGQQEGGGGEGEEEGNKLLICGQRSSHCSGFDVLELIDDLLLSSSIRRADNVFLLKDGEYVCMYVSMYVCMYVYCVVLMNY